MARTHDDLEQLADELRQMMSSLGVQSRDLDQTRLETQSAEDALTRIVARPPSEAGEAPSRSAVRRPWPRLMIAGGIAAAIAIALVVIQPGVKPDEAVARTPALAEFQFGDDFGKPTSDQSARVALDALAERASRQGSGDSGSIQLTVRDAWFLSTDEAKPGESGSSVLIPTVREQYTNPDGTIRAIEHRGHPLNRSGQVTGKTGSWSKLPTVSDEIFDGPETGPEYPESLSTKPAKLATQLIQDESECAAIRAFCLTNSITQLHYNYVFGPDLKSALWQVLADEPTVAYLGTSRDRLDRKAVAFAMPGADKSRRIILFADPETGALLGSEEMLVADSKELGVGAPAVIEFTALVKSQRIAAGDVPDVTSKTKRS